MKQNDTLSSLGNRRSIVSLIALLILAGASLQVFAWPVLTPAAPPMPGGGTLVQSCGPDNYTYCYPDLWDSTVTYQSINSFPIAILFNSGTMEVCCDEIYVYNGLSTASPLIYTGNGNSGNMAGLFFASNNPDNALTIVFNSDGSVDCASGQFGFLQLDWTVSCLDCTAPQATFGVDLDCANSIFYATVDIAAMGSDPVADITNNGGAPLVSATAPGSYLIGPFNLGTQVTVTIQNDLNPLCNLNSPVLTNAPCPFISCGPDNYSYCFFNGDQSTFVYQSASALPIGILFQSGQLDQYGDIITIYNGLNQFSPVLYSGNGNFGDLSGLLFTSTNPDNALTLKLNMNTFYSCTDGFFTAPWSYLVACYDGCTSPVATFDVVLDCVNNQFYIESDITSLGTASTIDISNSGGAPVVSATAPGVYLSGPFPIGTSATVTLDGGSPLCTLTSPALINGPCPLISCGPDNYTYCFFNSDQSVFVYQSSSTLPIGILFQSGLMDQYGDNITIYNGLNQLAPVLYSGNGNFGDLAGLLFTSTNPDNALTLVLNMNTFYSCTDGFFTAPWNYLVACYDGCTTPLATFDVELDCDSNQFFIESDITSLGTATTLNITNSGGAPVVSASAPGVYLSGPFSLGTAATVTLDGGSPLCSLTSPSLINGPCPVISCGPDNYTYCYGNSWDSTTVYQSANSFPIAILFNSGTMEQCCDEIYVYDGLNSNAPLIYTGNGTFGDMTGLFFTSTNPDNALTVVWNSDGSVDCASGFYGLIPLDWTVSCLDCTNPEATFTVVADCIQHAFFVEVNVTNTGTSSTVRLTDSYSGDTLVNIGNGITSIGPIPFDSTTVVTVINATNPLCRIFSPVFTYSSDSCIIEACDASLFEYCYDNGDTAWFVYESGNGFPITINFLAGQLLVNDYIQVFNGYDQLSGLLYQGNQGGNMQGFAVNSQNVFDALTLRIVSSPSGSCATGQGFPPLMWEVGCGAVGLNESSPDNLNLFPNPTNGTLFITGGEDLQGLVNMDVMDALGRVVKSLPITFIGGHNATIDLSDLDNGNYTLRFSTPHWVKARQVQVVR